MNPNFEELLSIVASNLNLRRYSQVFDFTNDSDGESVIDVSDNEAASAAAGGGGGGSSGGNGGGVGGGMDMTVAGRNLLFQRTRWIKAGGLLRASTRPTVNQLVALIPILLRVVYTSRSTRSAMITNSHNALIL